MWVTEKDRKELITEIVYELFTCFAFVCLAFGWCLPLARRVNIQTLAVMSPWLSHRTVLNKGRSLLVCTGRPLTMPNRGLGSPHLCPLPMCDHRGQIRASIQTSWLYDCSDNIHDGNILRLQLSFLWCVQSAVVWWINMEDLLDTFDCLFCTSREATRKPSLFQTCTSLHKCAGNLTVPYLLKPTEYLFI